MDTTYTLSHPVTLAFSKELFTPKPYKDPKTGQTMGDPLYSATFIFPEDHPEWKVIRQHAFKVAREEWPGVKWGDFTVPFRSGTEMADKRKEENGKNSKKKPDMEFARGCGVLHARSKWQPDLSYMEKGAIHDCPDDQAKMRAQSRFYFGAEVVAIFNFRASEVRKQKSVAAYINTVMATGKGKRIGGGKPGSEVWAGMAGKEVDENPGDDDIPY